jgi:nuclear transport factor 2 (NTF2) superfamily protein
VDTKPPLPPFTEDSARQKVRMAEDAWNPAGHPKLLHLWPVKLPQAGRSDYAYSAAVAMREAASFRR